MNKYALIWTYVYFPVKETAMIYIIFAAEKLSNSNMNGNITLTMIKPEAVRNGNTGNILAEIIKGGFV